MTKQLTTIEKKIIPLVTEAKSLNITSQEDMEIGTEILSQLNKMLDSVTTERERVTKPLNEALKAERSRWKPFETQLTDSIASIRLTMTKYATALANTQKAQEKAIADRIAPGKGNLSLSSAINRIEKIEKVPEIISTSAGTLKFREVKKYRVVDKAKIPLDFLMVDDLSIKDAMKADKEIAGIEYYTEQQPINYR